VSFSAFDSSIRPLARVGYKNVPDSKTDVLRTKFSCLESAKHGTAERDLHEKFISLDLCKKYNQRVTTNRNDETNASLYLKKVFRKGWMTLPIVRDFSAVELNDEMQRSKNLDVLALSVSSLALNLYRLIENR